MAENYRTDKRHQSRKLKELTPRLKTQQNNISQAEKKAPSQVFGEARGEPGECVVLDTKRRENSQEEGISHQCQIMER